MALVRYQSPDDSSFLVFDTLRFRVDHAVFLLRADLLQNSIREMIEERRDWNLQAMKLVQENQRLESCLEWLETLGDDLEMVAIPELKHEPAIDLVADHLIGESEFARAYCAVCEAEYTAQQVSREPWKFEEDGVTVRGLRTLCPSGHTIHVLTEGIDAPDLESSDDQLL
jgi:hypothetical protein